MPKIRKRTTKPKKILVIVEQRYVGLLPFPSWKEWYKWGSYRDAKTAQMVVDNLNRKYLTSEFRIHPTELG